MVSGIKEDQMDWKYVMSDRNVVAGTEKSDFMDLVLASGYRFFTWNGNVFGAVSVSDTNKICFDTGIITSELR